jgi:hypothetical protein
VRIESELWRPGIELSAMVIERASGGRITGNAAKMRTIMMVASLSSLSSGREVVTRAVGSDTTSGEARAEALAVLDEQIQHLPG